MKDLEKQYARDPKSRKFFPLAEEFARRGNLEKAVELLRKGLVIHPSYVGARVSLGRILIQLGKTDQARSELEKVIDLVPDNIMAHTLLGRIYEEKDMTEKALERFEMVLLLNPMDEVIKAKVENLRKKSPEADRGIDKMQESAEPTSSAASGTQNLEDNEIRFDLPGEAPQPEKTDVPVASETEMELTSEDISFDLPDEDEEEEDQAGISGEMDENPFGDDQLPAISDVLDKNGKAPSEETFTEEIPPENISESTAPAGDDKEDVSEKNVQENDFPLQVPESSEELEEDMQFDESGETAMETSDQEEVSFDLPSNTDEQENDAPSGSQESDSLDDEDIQFDIPDDLDDTVSAGEDAIFEIPDEEDVSDGNQTIEGAFELLEDDISINDLVEEKEKQLFETKSTPEEPAKQKPVDSIQTLSLARVYLNQGYYERAKEILESILKNNPDDTEANAVIEEVKKLQQGGPEKQRGISADGPWKEDLDDSSKQIILDNLNAYLDTVTQIKNERGIPVLE